MKITKIEPKILCYRVETERTDKENFACSWVDYTLNLEEYRLTIIGDAGSYSCGWCPTSSESFIKLMSRVDEEYLLDKFSTRSYFLFKESLEGTLRDLEYVVDDETLGKIREDITYAHNEDDFFYQLSDIIPSLSYEDMYIEKDYPLGAKVSVGLFINHIQPLLKNMVKEN